MGPGVDAVPEHDGALDDRGENPLGGLGESLGSAREIGFDAGQVRLNPIGVDHVQVGPMTRSQQSSVGASPTPLLART